MLYTRAVLLSQMIEGNTRAEILQNADRLHVRMKRSGKKAALARQLADTIRLQPLTLLHRLPWHELLKLQQMVHNENHAVIRDSRPQQSLSVCGSGKKHIHCCGKVR